MLLPQNMACLFFNSELLSQPCSFLLFSLARLTMSFFPIVTDYRLSLRVVFALPALSEQLKTATAVAGATSHSDVAAGVSKYQQGRRWLQTSVRGLHPGEERRCLLLAN